MLYSSRRRSPLAKPRKCVPPDDAAQIWSLAFYDKASVPADAQQQDYHSFSGCTISFLDLVDTSDGESLRLYIDAETEDGVSEPMSSSLSVLELPAPTAPAATAPRRGGAPAPTPTQGGAWAATQWAWYPDAAHVCCGRPGHYQGCLVWGNTKTQSILSALAADGRCTKALAFAYAGHPVDAALLGRRPSHTVEVLLEVGPSGVSPQEDLWSRLPGSTFEVVCGGVPEHHQRRLRELRLAGSGGNGGGFAAPSAVGSGDGCAYCFGAAANGACPEVAGLDTCAAARQFESGEAGPPRGRRQLARDDSECSSSACCDTPWRAGSDSSGLCSISTFASACRCGGGGGACSDVTASGSSFASDAAGHMAALALHAGPPGPSPLCCSCGASSGASSAASGGAGTPAAMTPTHPGARSRRGSHFSADGAPGAGTSSGGSAPVSPFALVCGEEYWDDEMLVVAAGGW